jgi:ribonuclease Z
VNGAASTIRLIGFAIAFAVAALAWALTCAAWRFDKVAAGVVPLDPREFARMTVVALGTAGAWEDPNRRGPAIAVGRGSDVVLVDAGRGVAEALRAAKIPVSQPSVVLLTSTLPENVVGLDDLLASADLAGRREPVTVYGPAGTTEAVRAAMSVTGPGMRAQRAAQGLAGEPLGFQTVELDGDRGGFSLELREMTLRALDLPGGSVAALAWRFEWRGRVAVVSSTGWAPDALVERVKGAHLWVHEAVMLPPPEQARELGIDEDPEVLRRQAALHTDVTQVGALAQRAGVETLVLVRLRPPPVYDLQITSLVDDSFPGRIVIPEDGDEITP